MLPICLPFGVSTGPEVVGAFEASGPAGCWLWSSGGVFPAFWSLCCFALGALLANMALFRIFRAFLGGFPCWMWVCIASMLCVACGAFVCVRCLAVLGLVACLPLFLSFCLSPFAFRFISLLLLLSFCPCVSVSALFCLSSCLVFPFLLCFVVSFSLTDYMQKERAQFLASSPVLL